MTPSQMAATVILLFLVACSNRRPAESAHSVSPQIHPDYEQADPPPPLCATFRPTQTGPCGLQPIRFFLDISSDHQ
jgi:hypothetical protein